MADTSTNSTRDRERTTVTMIRHGESEVTVDSVIGGIRTCRGLSPLGRSQSERLRDRLLRDRELVPDALISSDFPRAIETAAIIRPGLSEPCASRAAEQWVDFGEHDPGAEIDGMSFEAYLDRFGTPDWEGDPDIDIFPGGETTRQFHERVAGGLTILLERFDGRHVLVVCHGGVIDATLRILFDLRRTGGFELHTLNTAITTFSVPAIVPSDSCTAGARPLWRLETYNDSGHLAGLPAATPRRRVPNR